MLLGAAVATPLNRTTGVPTLRFAPVRTTVVPGGPNVGEKPDKVGRTTKFEGEKAEAPGTTTRINPLRAPAGTATTRFELFMTEKLLAATPPKETAVAPTRLVPLSTTLVFARPEVGAKLVSVGLPKKLELVTKLPTTVWTVMGPVVTPLGAATCNRVSEVALRMTPGRPLNVTLVTDEKCRPSIRIFVPLSPQMGEKSVT